MHIVQQLSKEGHIVRASVRNLEDKNKVDPIKEATHGAKHPVQFVAADLTNPES